MNLVGQLWRSSLGRKFAMALTGAMLFLFLVGHLAEILSLRSRSSSMRMRIS